MNTERMRCWSDGSTLSALESPVHRFDTCGALEGAVHRFGCNAERCSQCNGYYLYCDCPEPRHKRPRAPFIVFPNLCEKCGTLWPEFFNVPNDVWQHYILALGDGDKLICIDCWDFIIKAIDGGAYAEKHGGAIMFSEIRGGWLRRDTVSL